jgi:hypothetical protein
MLRHDGCGNGIIGGPQARQAATVAVMVSWAVCCSPQRCA